MDDDTIKLLRECNAGIKMGVSSLEDVMEHVTDNNLRRLLQKSIETHSRLGNTTHGYLISFHNEGKEPPTMAKMMSWVKSNIKFSEDEPNRAAAELLTDGCNMGVKSLYRYLHQYPNADKKVKKLAEDVIEAEETLIKELQDYL